jgi:hypothetical protein
MDREEQQREKIKRMISQLEEMDSKNREIERKINEERLKNAVEKTKIEGAIEKIRVETDGRKGKKKAFTDMIMK